jgi:hypothetical protein
MKKYITGFFAFMALFVTLTSCYKEPDMFEDLIDSKGKVAQIPVVWLGDTKVFNTGGVLQPGASVAAGSQVKVNIEYTSEIGVKEFKIYSAATATGTQTLVSTTAAGGERYDAELRNYVIGIPVTAPAEKNATVVLFAEVITENGLASLQKNVTLRTNP